MKKLDQLKYLTFILFILFLCCEVYLRMFKAENMVLHDYPKIYRFDPDPDVGYRGVPNIDGYIRRPSMNKHFKLNNFGFYGEELFYLSNDKVIFYDLYSEKNREVKIENGKFVIVTDERIFLVKGNNRVVVYEFLADNSEENPKEK